MASRNILHILVVPGVKTSTQISRSDADAASVDRVPTTSGDQKQEILDWLQPFTEGLVEAESGSSGSAGETIPPHIAARPSNKSGGKHKLFTHFPKDRGCKRTNITGAPCRRNPESREDGIPRATKVWDVITADHKVLNEETESRSHHWYAEW